MEYSDSDINFSSGPGLLEVDDWSYSESECFNSADQLCGLLGSSLKFAGSVDAGGSDNDVLIFLVSFTKK